MCTDLKVPMEDGQRHRATPGSVPGQALGIDLLLLLLLCGTERDAAQRHRRVSSMRGTAAQRYWQVRQGTDGLVAHRLITRRSRVQIPPPATNEGPGQSDSDQGLVASWLRLLTDLVAESISGQPWGRERTCVFKGLETRVAADHRQTWTRQGGRWCTSVSAMTLTVWSGAFTAGGGLPGVRGWGWWRCRWRTTRRRSSSAPSHCRRGRRSAGWCPNQLIHARTRRLVLARPGDLAGYQRLVEEARALIEQARDLLGTGAEAVRRLSLW